MSLVNFFPAFLSARPFASSCTFSEVDEIAHEGDDDEGGDDDDDGDDDEYAAR